MRKNVKIKRAKIAKDAGYDAVLLSPEGLNDLSEEEMFVRTKAVAGFSGIGRRGQKRLLNILTL